jgi:hypothetical protein
MNTQRPSFVLRRRVLLLAGVGAAAVPALDPVGGSADQFGRFIRQSVDYWAKVIKETGVTVAG